MFKKFVLLVVLGGCSTIFLWCSDDGQGQSPAEMCQGVSCSGHGRCAVTAEGTTVCLCESGYHAEGLECVADTSGPECGEPSSCPEGTVCDAESGTCVSLDASVCGLPESENGLAGLWETCEASGSDPSERCLPGLTCVSDHRYAVEMQRDEAPKGFVAGSCLMACDPCEPSCPPGQGCALLPDGRGVCVTRVCRPVAPCDEGGLCMGGVLVYGDCLPRQATEKCEVDPNICPVCCPECEYPGPLSTGSACESPDCPDGTVCFENVGSIHGDLTVCRIPPEGALVPAGYPVGLRGMCRGCANPRFLTPSESPFSVCSTNCDSDWWPCPDDVECFDFGENVGGRCVADGALPAGYPCVADRNCASGTCGPDDTSHTGKRCQ